LACGFNLGCALHPQSFRPQDIIALDSQLCDKAFATQPASAPNKPA
jgi:hypothetical protein